MFTNEPREVKDDEDLRFDLRYHNAEMATENQDAAKKRGERLQAKGAFRTLLPPKTGFRRRAGQQNWSEKIHSVQAINGGRVVDTDGASFPMSTVLAVPATTVSTSVSAFAEGGSRKVDDKRRTAMRPWLQDMVEVVTRAGGDGEDVASLSKKMREKPGFSQQLKDQRATMTQIVRLFPEFTVEKLGATTRVKLAAAGSSASSSAAATRSPGTLDAFAS